MELRGPGRRAGLTRVQVLAAAREVLAEQGLAGLTMRRLAQRLGVAPNALYSHVASKTALVDEVLDEVLGEVEAPDQGADAAGGDGAGGVEAVMTSTYRVLLAHPDLVGLYLARQGARGPQAQHLGQVVLAHLAAAGVDGPPARDALRVLIVFTIGSAAFAVSSRDRQGEGRAVDVDDLHTSFQHGLRWLLAGALQPRDDTGAAVDG